MRPEKSPQLRCDGGLEVELRYERGFDGRRSRIGMQEPRTHRHPSRQFISRIKLPCQTCPMMKTSFCPQSPHTSPEAPPSVMLSSMRALLCSMIVLLSESIAAHQHCIYCIGGGQRRSIAARTGIAPVFASD